MERNVSDKACLLEPQAAPAGGIIGTLPGIVFQVANEVLTFQAKMVGGEVVVTMTNSTNQPDATAKLTPDSPTALLDYALWVGSGAIELTTGTISLKLRDPMTVIATAVFTVLINQSGNTQSSVGGTFIILIENL